MLGVRQMGWLQQSLVRSTAKWNVLAQQTLMGLIDKRPGDRRVYSMDSWPGYAYERQRLLEFLDKRRVPNPIVLTGDNHANWVNDLRIDDHKPEAPVIATEFAGTSISSSGDGADKLPNWNAIMADNPGVRLFNGQRGYVRCTVTPDEWRSDFQVLQLVSQPNEPITTRASFVIEAGTRGAKRA
jgi:alkaline phosphatase D